MKRLLEELDAMRLYESEAMVEGGDLEGACLCLWFLRPIATSSNKVQLTLHRSNVGKTCVSRRSIDVLDLNYYLSLKWEGSYDD